MSDQKPAIAIIGAAGTMGSRLLRRLLSVGYELHVNDNNTVALKILQVSERRLFVHQTALEASLASQVVVLAIPYVSEQKLAESLSDQLGDRIVVSITNPLTPTLDDVVTPHDESAAEHLAQLMPHARIVKALNSLSASAMEIEMPPDRSFDTFVASDDREAARVVEQIITDIGFHPYYVGGLILSRTLERMSALLIGISMRYGLQGALGWRVKHVQPPQNADV